MKTNLDSECLITPLPPPAYYPNHPKMLKIDKNWRGCLSNAICGSPYITPELPPANYPNHPKMHLWHFSFNFDKNRKLKGDLKKNKEKS